MASQGPNSPTSGANVDRGLFDWSNPGNVVSNNSQYASLFLGATGAGDYLHATNFGFSIPSSATVLGILAEIERYEGDAGGDFKDETVQLLKGGTPVGTNKASAAEWPTAETYASYGGSTDLWGASWAAADINAATFGLRLAAQGNAEFWCYVDHVRITVYYQAVLSVAETLALAEAVAFKTNRSVTDTLALAEAIATKAKIPLADVLTLVDSVSLSLFKALSIDDQLALAEALSVKIGKGLTEDMMLADSVALAFKFEQAVTDTLSLADVTSLFLSKNLSEALLILDALSLKIGKPISESATLLEAVRVFLTDLAPAQTIYMPRPLLTLTIGAETKRYSSEDVII